MRTITAIFAAALLATAVGTGAGPTASQPTAASSADQAFVFSVLQEARGQIAFARFAEPRAQSVAVQQLAATTLDEWSALAARLDPIAGAWHEAEPAALTPAQQRILTELAQTHPEDFDTAYVRVAETDYERVVEAFRSEGGTRDPAITNAIASVRPDFERLDRQTNEDPALPGTF